MDADEVVTLLVGGRDTVQVLKSTLCSREGVLKSIVEGGYKHPKINGALFIDTEPSLFDAVLQVLRGHSLQAVLECYSSYQHALVKETLAYYGLIVDTRDGTFVEDTSVQGMPGQVKHITLTDTRESRDKAKQLCFVDNTTKEEFRRLVLGVLGEHTVRDLGYEKTHIVHQSVFLQKEGGPFVPCPPPTEVEDGAAYKVMITY
eukprot:TRINITY_DN113222_c0_g1_i1.p1 TRINITY_DN113222_c0_g1~~TRINITY_DN113222_c0_g1_i1.p1  ORF type:complete len:203 (+),score=17.32 TRINITY_DN113222_c0_g1_i1:98-706(+)